MKIEKGQPGYIKAEKTKYLMWAVGEFAISIALLVLGYVQTGTKLNLFTLFAILGCLPASKMLVEYITMAPHKSIDAEKFQEIEQKAELLTRVYDLIITGNDKVMPVDALVISSHTICGYTSSEKTDEVKIARYLKEMLHNNRCDKITVKVFHDYAAFLSRVEGMNNIAAVDQANQYKKEQKIRKLLLSTAI